MCNGQSALVLDTYSSTSQTNTYISFELDRLTSIIQEFLERFQWILKQSETPLAYSSLAGGTTEHSSI